MIATSRSLPGLVREVDAELRRRYRLPEGNGRVSAEIVYRRRINLAAGGLWDDGVVADGILYADYDGTVFFVEACTGYRSALLSVVAWAPA